MPTIDPTDPACRAEVISEWATALATGSRQALARMDRTLSLAEAKVALVRQLRSQRREWESDHPAPAHA
ncbi:MAG TPA: hypothetical protein VH092_16155 [Urbifossiella sp.]|jgi:hypothetical protein|nr:hypothetical protein [Urbifossiella sp.]